YGNERVHFEAPPASQLPAMMGDFLTWFNSRREKDNGLVRAALAHLWFETLHPFRDGNGRLGRAIVDKALAQDERTPRRYYSLSSQMATERNDYYNALEEAQRGPLDVTPWVSWFLGCLIRAIEDAQGVVARARSAAEFWNRHDGYTFNERQRKALWRLLGDF